MENDGINVEVIKGTKDKIVTVKVEMKPRSKRDKEPVIRWRLRQVEKELTERKIKFGKCLKADFISNDISGDPGRIPKGEWIFELLTTTRKKTTTKKTTTKIEAHPAIEEI